MTDENRSIASPPIHGLAAIAIIALDGVLGTFEILDPPLILITSILIGILGFLSTTFVQRFLAKDGWGSAAAKGMVLGILAGVPYPVIGTAIGVPLLIWAGVHRWAQLPGFRNRALLDDPDEKE